MQFPGCLLLNERAFFVARPDLPNSSLTAHHSFDLVVAIRVSLMTTYCAGVVGVDAGKYLTYNSIPFPLVLFSLSFSQLIG